MTVTAIDTHAVVKELKAAGFSDAQAEAVTDVVRRARVDIRDLPTKADLAEQKVEIMKVIVLVAMGVQTVVLLVALMGFAPFIRP